MHRPSVCCKVGFENNPANGKDVFRGFMDLEKAYDTIDRHGMLQMLRAHGLQENY